MKNILLGLGAIVLVGGGMFAYGSRDILKGYFEKGDKPTQEQFESTIDSGVNAQGDVSDPAGSKEYNPSKTYSAGDTVLEQKPIYQAKVVTQGQTEFKLDSVQDVTFRWSPPTAKSSEPMTYRLRVWQLMQGQSGAQAMKSNAPLVTREVVGATEATVSGIYTGPCRPPYLCDFVWSTELISTANSQAGSLETVKPTETQSTGAIESAAGVSGESH